jgi:hypothetical protein
LYIWQFEIEKPVQNQGPNEVPKMQDDRTKSILYQIFFNAIPFSLLILLATAGSTHGSPGFNTPDSIHFLTDDPDTIHTAMDSQSATESLFVNPDTALVGTPGTWLVRLAVSSDVPARSYVLVEVPRMWQAPQVNDSTRSGFAKAWTSNNARLTVRVVSSNMDGYPGYTKAVLIHLGRWSSLPAGDTLYVRFGQSQLDSLGLKPNLISGKQHAVVGIWRPDGTYISKTRYTITVNPKPATEFKVVAPTVVKEGGNFKIRISCLDQYGNLDWRFGGLFRLTSDRGFNDFVEIDSGRGVIEQVSSAEGYHRFALIIGSNTWNSNTMAVSRATKYNIYWGDSHSHGILSNHGLGLPGDILEYARLVSCLDWVSYTEHDYITDDFYVAYSVKASNKAYRPNEFVTLIALEYTADSPPLGHMTIMSPLSVPPQLSFSQHSTIPAVLKALKAIGGIAIINHPFLSGVSFNRWEDVDTSVVRSVEMVNEMKSFEFPLTSGGGSIKQKLDLGYILGFMGASDNHMPHPGMHYTTNLVPGLTAVVCDSLTRESVFQALKERRTYVCVNGIRPYIDFTANDYPIGSVVSYSTDNRVVRLGIEVATSRIIDTLRIMKKAGAVFSVRPNAKNAQFVIWDTLRSAEDYYYLFVSTQGGGKAWTSPIYFRESGNLSVSGMTKPGQPGEFNLLQPYPNPFNGVTAIQYRIAEDSRVRLAVYDLLGQQIALLEEGNKSSGYHTARWNSDAVSSGVYFCRLEAIPGSLRGMPFVAVRKIVLLK